jgi:hypothetical protein
MVEFYEREEETDHLTAAREMAVAITRLEEQLEAIQDILRGFLHDADNGDRPSEGLRDMARAALFPAIKPLCPDCQGRGATDTETGFPCTRPSASCEECFTCDGTGHVPSPASEPEAS